MRISMLVATASLLAGSLSPAYAQTPTPLAPVGEWEASLEGNTCVVLHRYLDGDEQPVTLVLRPNMIGDGFTIIVDRPHGDWSSGDAAFSRGKGGTAEPLGEVRTYATVTGSWISFIEATRRVDPRAEDELGRHVPLTEDTLFLRVEDQFDYAFPLPKVARVVEAMDKCASILRARFGIADHLLDEVAVYPDLIKSGVRKKHFPRKMRQRGQQARPQLLLWINEQGRVDDCTLLEPSGHAEFDERLCERMKFGARYEPARDADGNPLRAPLTQRIIFAF